MLLTEKTCIGQATYNYQYKKYSPQYCATTATDSIKYIFYFKKCHPKEQMTAQCVSCYLQSEVSVIVVLVFH